MFITSNFLIETLEKLTKKDKEVSTLTTQVDVLKTQITGNYQVLHLCHSQYVLFLMRMSFIARYFYTNKEFVLVTEAPQCNKMTATGQDTDNKE